MAHSKYSSFCFLIAEANTGEDDKMLSLFCEGFGFLRVLAKSVRREGAKLSGALRKGALLSVTLLKGREVWRLLEVEEIEELPYGTPGYKVFLRSTKLLQSLVHGEEKNDLLFAYIRSMFENLAGIAPHKEKDAEIIFSLQILYALGYIPINAVTTPVLEMGSGTLQKELPSAERVELVSLINKGISASHL